MNDETQFAGFAGLLFGELDIMFKDLASERAHEDYETAFKTEQKIKDYIACRAYDLVSHTFYNTGPRMLDCCSHEEQIAAIPDMATWPEEKR